LSKQAKFDLKCSKMRWRLGLAYDAPPDPLIMSCVMPKALAPRHLEAKLTPSFLWSNLTLGAI